MTWVVLGLLAGSVGLAIGWQRERVLLNRVRMFARLAESSELPEQDTWPDGFTPKGVAHEVDVTNGHGGVLKLRVRNGAFRVVSFTRPTKFDPLTGEGDTTDLWLSVDELVKKVRQPWTKP